MLAVSNVDKPESHKSVTVASLLYIHLGQYLTMEDLLVPFPSCAIELLDFEYDI